MKLDKLIVFSLDGQHYGLPLDCVTKVVRAVEITPIPNANHFILGIINVHGEIIPVVNLRQFLNLAQKTICLSDHFIITQMTPRKIIFVVDTISIIEECHSNEIIPVNHFSSGDIEYLQGTLTRNNDLIYILDIKKIVAHGHFQPLRTKAAEGNETA